VSGSQRLREKYCIHVQGSRDLLVIFLGASFSLEDLSTMLLGMSGVTRPRTRRHVPEDLNTHRCENLLKQHLFLIGRREKSYFTSGAAKETLKNSNF